MLNLLRTLHRCFARSRRVAGRCPAVEVLEGRALPTVLQPYSHLLGPLDGPGAVPGYTPTQIRHVYGFDQVNFTPGAAAATGAGVTIAIVTAFDDPNLAADLATFNARFNLPAAPLTQVAQDGSPNLPAADASWAQETAMDVEWAHAMAPGAGLLVVEANSGDEADLYAAVDQATSRPDVQVVSMSFGGPEDPAETNADQHFLTPAGHAGITFVAAAGDTGAVSYPAASPNVLAVGGTTLNLAADGSRASETAWASGGGGLSQYESAAGFQAAVQPAHLASRGSPDVAYNANPTTGFAVCDSFNDPNRPWISVGGTSAGAPQWAALIALADQGRALAGQGSLDGPTQTLPLLYSAPGAFYDVIQGGNDHFQAGPGG